MQLHSLVAMLTLHSSEPTQPTESVPTTAYGVTTSTLGIGLGYDSCCAAVAVAANGASASYGAPDPLGFRMVYGSSRLYQGLDPDVPQGPAPNSPFSSSLNAEHAEQTAILAAANAGMTFWNDGAGHCHIYVDFNPCPNCYPWLVGRPENWWVHYHTNLAAPDREITKEKKRLRREEFGRITEPKRVKA